MNTNFNINNFEKDILQIIYSSENNKCITEIGTYKNFFLITEYQLYSILFCLIEKKENHTSPSFLWIEKLLRYVEINKAKLLINENKNNRKSEEYSKIYTLLLLIFIITYEKTLDIRYLNTALKILDLKWAKPNKKSLNYLQLYQMASEKAEQILNQL